MSTDRWMGHCERCGKQVKVGLHTRRPYYCSICEIEAESDPDTAPVLGILAAGEKTPKSKDMPDVDSRPTPESEAERQQRFTRNDHNWAMDHDYWRKPSKDR